MSREMSLKPSKVLAGDDCNRRCCPIQAENFEAPLPAGVRTRQANQPVGYGEKWLYAPES
jgi:hypothetical protein